MLCSPVELTPCLLQGRRIPVLPRDSWGLQAAPVCCRAGNGGPERVCGQQWEPGQSPASKGPWHFVSGHHAAALTHRLHHRFPFPLELRDNQMSGVSRVHCCGRWSTRQSFFSVRDSDLWTQKAGPPSDRATQEKESCR